MIRQGLPIRGRRGFRTFIDSSSDNDRLALAAVQRAERAEADETLLKRVRVPTLLFVGSEDPTREAVQVAARMIPAASLVVLPGEDHFSALRAQTGQRGRWRVPEAAGARKPITPPRRRY